MPEARCALNFNRKSHHVVYLYGTVLEEPKPVVDVIIVGQQSAHEDVRVTVDIFGCRVHDYVGAKLQGSLRYCVRTYLKVFPIP